MAFTFSFSGTEYRLNQTGTDTNLTGIATAVTAIPTVTRSTAYTVGTILKPPTKNGMWHRCSVAGTTSGTAPTYSLTVGGSTVDGTATFIAFREPEIYTMGNVTVYEIVEATLYVNGTLTIDPRVNLISALNNVYPMGTSTLNCGVQFTSSFGGGTLYSKGVAIRFRGNFQPQPGSIFNLRGATMHSTSTNQQAHEFKSTAYVRDGVWLGEINLNSRLRLNSANLDVDGFYVYGVQCDMLMTPSASTIVKNVKSVNIGVGFDNAFVNGSGTATAFVYDGVPSSIGNVSTGFSNWLGRNNLQLINCENGSLEMIMPDNCGNSTTSGFGGRVYQKYQIYVQNTSGNAIQDAITYLKDTNNGKRKIKNIAGGVVVDNTADQIQILTTNSSGITPVTQIMTSYIYRNNTVGDIGAPDGNEIRDLRGKVDTAGSDLFDVTIFEYNYVITPITDIAMKGLLNVSTGTRILSDTNVTLSKANAIAKLASSFTIDPVTKVITVTANSTYDDLYDVIKAYKCTATQVNLETPTLSNLIINPSGSNLIAYIGWSLVINTGVTLSTGTKFTYLYVPTITLNGTGKITAVYATTAGTSTVLELNTPSAGYSLCIFKADGTTKYFASNVAIGSYYVYFAPNEAGTYYLGAENYGQKRTADTLVLNGGNVWYNITDQEDVGITDTKTNVASYTTLTTTSQIYDATAYFRLTETGIKLGQLCTRDGVYLDFSTYNVKIKDDASAIVSVASGTITYKSIVINETTKYNAMKATPPKTITPTDTEIINVLIEDANGDSKVSILGGDNLGYELWKVTTATATDDYATGTLLTTLANNSAPYRFIGISGYDMVGRDISSGVRRRSSMLKGTYTQAFYVGNQIQLATDAPQLQENNDKLSEVILKLDTKLDVAISTRLADADYIDPATPQQVWEYTTRTLTSEGASGATLAEIEGSLILAKKAQIDALGSPMQADDYVAPDNATISEISTKIDTSGSTNKADLTIINNNVKKASKFIPASQNLT